MTDVFFDKLRRLMSAKDAEELQKARPFLLELLERAEVQVEEAEELVTHAILDWIEHDREPGLVHFVDARCREYARRKHRPYTGLKETAELVGRAWRAWGAARDTALRPLAPKEFSPSGGAEKVRRTRRGKPKV